MKTEIEQLETLTATLTARFEKGLAMEKDSPIPLQAVTKLGNSLRDTLLMLHAAKSAV